MLNAFQLSSTDCQKSNQPQKRFFFSLITALKVNYNAKNFALTIYRAETIIFSS